MHWGWYLESPQNPWLPGLLSWSCSSPLSLNVSCSTCSERCDIVMGKACCHHASPLVTCCNKTYNGIRYGAHIFHFVMLLSFIRFQRNPNIPLENVKNICISPRLLLTQCSVCVHLADLPGVDAHLNQVSFPCHDENSCMLLPSSPQPRAYCCVSKASCYFRNL